MMSKQATISWKNVVENQLGILLTRREKIQDSPNSSKLDSHRIISSYLHKNYFTFSENTHRTLNWMELTPE